MQRTDPRRRELEEKIFQLIVDFPERLDEMETRNEENCRLLARRIVSLVEEEAARKPPPR